MSTALTTTVLISVGDETPMAASAGGGALWLRLGAGANLVNITGRGDDLARFLERARVAVAAAVGEQP